MTEMAGVETTGVELTREEAYRLADLLGAQTIAGAPIGDVHPLDDAQPPAAEVDAVAPLITRIAALREQVRIWSQELAEAEAAVKDLLGEREVGTVAGRPAVTWKHHLRHSLDTDLLKKERPEVYAAFQRASTVRRFVILGEQ
jgi:hypothetical protein